MSKKYCRYLTIIFGGSLLALASCFQHTKVASEMKNQLDASVYATQRPVILSTSERVDLVMIVAPYVTESGIMIDPLSSLIDKNAIHEIVEDMSFQDRFQIFAFHRGKIVDRAVLSNNMRINGSVLLIAGESKFAVDFSVDAEEARPIEIVAAIEGGSSESR